MICLFNNYYPSEIDSAAELHPPHLVLRSKSSDSTRCLICYVSIRHSQVCVIERVRSIHSESKTRMLGQAEVLCHRKILVDKLRAIQRIDRIVAKRVLPRQEKSAAQSTNEPLITITLRICIRITASQIRPIIRPNRGPGIASRKRSNRWRKR